MSHLHSYLVSPFVGGRRAQPSMRRKVITFISLFSYLITKHTLKLTRSPNFALTFKLDQEDGFALTTFIRRENLFIGSIVSHNIRLKTRNSCPESCNFWSSNITVKQAIKQAKFEKENGSFTVELFNSDESTSFFPQSLSAAKSTASSKKRDANPYSKRIFHPPGGEN